MPSDSGRIIRDVAALDGLAEAWDALAAPALSPMQQYSWARACAATFTGRRELHVVAVNESAGFAVAPLVRRRGVLGRVEFLGALELDEPADVIAADDASLALLAETLVRSGHPLLLKRIPAESPLVPALVRAYRGRGLVIHRRLAGLSVDLPRRGLDAPGGAPQCRSPVGSPACPTDRGGDRAGARRSALAFADRPRPAPARGLRGRGGGVEGARGDGARL